jgi:hypothetical protein
MDIVAMGHEANLFLQLETLLLALAGVGFGMLTIALKARLRGAPDVNRAAATASGLGLLFCARHVGDRLSAPNVLTGGQLLADQLWVLGMALAMVGLGLSAFEFKFREKRGRRGP